MLKRVSSLPEYIEFTQGNIVYMDGHYYRVVEQGLKEVPRPEMIPEPEAE